MNSRSVQLPKLLTNPDGTPKKEFDILAGIDISGSTGQGDRPKRGSTSGLNQQNQNQSPKNQSPRGGSMGPGPGSVSLSQSTAKRGSVTVTSGTNVTVQQQQQYEPSSSSTTVPASSGRRSVTGIVAPGNQTDHNVKELFAILNDPKQKNKEQNLKQTGSDRRRGSSTGVSGTGGGPTGGRRTSSVPLSSVTTPSPLTPSPPSSPNNNLSDSNNDIQNLKRNFRRVSHNSQSSMTSNENSNLKPPSIDNIGTASAALSVASSQKSSIYTGLSATTGQIQQTQYSASATIQSIANQSQQQNWEVKSVLSQTSAAGSTYGATASGKSTPGSQHSPLQILKKHYQDLGTTQSQMSDSREVSSSSSKIQSTKVSKSMMIQEDGLKGMLQVESRDVVRAYLLSMNDEDGKSLLDSGNEGEDQQNDQIKYNPKMGEYLNKQIENRKQLSNQQQQNSTSKSVNQNQKVTGQQIQKKNNNKKDDHDSDSDSILSVSDDDDDKDNLSKSNNTASKVSSKSVISNSLVNNLNALAFLGLGAPSSPLSKTSSKVSQRSSNIQQQRRNSFSVGSQASKESPINTSTGTKTTGQQQASNGQIDLQLQQQQQRMLNKNSDNLSSGINLNQKSIADQYAERQVLASLSQTYEYARKNQFQMIMNGLVEVNQQFQRQNSKDGQTGKESSGLSKDEKSQTVSGGRSSQSMSATMRRGNIHGSVADVLNPSMNNMAQSSGPSSGLASPTTPTTPSTPNAKKSPRRASYTTIQSGGDQSAGSSSQQRRGSSGNVLGYSSTGSQSQRQQNSSSHIGSSDNSQSSPIVLHPILQEVYGLSSSQSQQFSSSSTTVPQIVYYHKEVLVDLAATQAHTESNVEARSDVNDIIR